MFKNYILIALRSIARQKIFSTINIIGLSIGLACTILLYLWIQDELNYDKFHKNIDNIALVCQHQYLSGNEKFTVSPTPAPLVHVLKKDYPEIIKATRLGYSEVRTLKYKENIYDEMMAGADPELFQIFSFDFINGISTNVLSEPNTIVITESIAKKLFKNEDPVNKSILIDNTYNFKIVAVIKDLPLNSSLDAKCYFTFEHYKNLDRSMENWGSNWFLTFVLLKNNIDYENLNLKIKDILKKNLTNYPSKPELFLFPYKNNHLYRIDGTESGMRNVKIFSLIAFLILLIACINFTNLTTIKAEIRAKEVGLRKVVGASKKQLIKQFLCESLFYSFIAINIAIIIVRLLLPFFNDFTNKELSLIYSDFVFDISLFGIMIITGVLAGLYPAFYLSKFIPAKTLKNEFNKNKKGVNYFRIILVIFQFSIAIILITCTIVIYQQTQYILNKNIGIEKENIIAVSLTGKSKEKKELIKSELTKNTNILSVTMTSHLPIFAYSNGSGWTWEGKAPGVNPLVTLFSADFDFLKTMNTNMSQGRFYSSVIPSDTTYGEKSCNIVINEAFAKIMNKPEIIGESLKVLNEPYEYKILGVIKDFSYSHISRAVEPMIIYFSKPHFSYMIIRVNGANIKESINSIKDVFKEYNPDFPFTYKFLDEEYNKMYQNEQNLGKIYSSFSILAIFISCLGLFGLSAFTAQQRRKEIGIRKSIGASTASIILMLGKNITKWVIVSMFIAIPVSWIYLKSWLDNYSSRIDLSAFVFISVGIGVLVIALITVVYQAYKAAMQNPVNSLKYE